MRKLFSPLGYILNLLLAFHYVIKAVMTQLSQVSVKGAKCLNVGFNQAATIDKREGDLYRLKNLYDSIHNSKAE